jgi:hypothetical protein
MSNNYWDDDDDEDTTNNMPMDDSNLIKQLRKKAKADEKQMKELREQLDGFSKAQKEAIIKKVLETNGVSPKAARLIAKELDGDVTEETVMNYLEDNAEVFGLEVQYEEQSTQTIDRAALRQQDIVTQQALTPDRTQDMEQRIDDAQSAEDILLLLGRG